MSKLFVVAGTVVAASWFLGVIEGLLMWRFVPFVYMLGVPVLDQAVSLPRPRLPGGSIGETETGTFKVLQSDTTLFRMAFRVVGFQIRTPFPIKGVLRWEATGARAVGRIPVGSTVFFGAWLVGWTVATGYSSIVGVLFTIFGWLFTVGLVWFSLWYELRRARRILTELRNALQGASA